MVSVVMDYGRREWAGGFVQPTITPGTIWPPNPTAPIMPTAWPTPEQWEEYKKLLKTAMEFDRKTGQPDCEDPKKAEWFKTMDERMVKLEQAVTKLTETLTPRG